MKRDTVRAIVAAAALLTVQALMLAALAAGTAHGRTVYRCVSRQGAGPETGISYQAQPCTEGPGTPIEASDTRSAAQHAQAHTNHARQMAWLKRQETTAGKPAVRAKRASSSRRHQRKTETQASTRAVPLSSHRIGERPFERLGQQVTPPSPVQKRKRTRYDITARTPAHTEQRKDLSPSP